MTVDRRGACRRKKLANRLPITWCIGDAQAAPNGHSDLRFASQR